MKLKLAELPGDLNEACRLRGYGDNSIFSFEEALAEWAAWHIGDSRWARDMTRLHREYRSIEFIKNRKVRSDQ